MFTVIASIVVMLVAALLIYAATKPDTFRVRRSAKMNAPPERMFPLIIDFHSWGAWYEWESNGKAGVGRMEITESSPPSQVTINLDFLKPFKGHNIAEFTRKPKAAPRTSRGLCTAPFPIWRR